MTALIQALRAAPVANASRRFATDRVIILLAGGLGLLLLLDSPQAGRSSLFVLDAFAGIAPFLLLAVGFAGYATATGASGVIARAFSGRPAVAIISAALVGAFSPFCSCGVIPLVAALLGAGVPLAPVMAFWISSPIMDPEMFVLTAAGIGFEFAVAKTMATVGMGVLAGFTVLGLQHLGRLKDPLRAVEACGGCRAEIDPSAKVEVAWAFWTDPTRRRAFLQESRSIGWFLAKWLGFAFFLESLMVAYIPGEWIATAVGGDSRLAIPLSVMVGVPAYLNGYAAIPLVAGLLQMGMSPGAAMAFMTAGAVSSIPAAIAVYALVRRPVFGLYLALGLTGSMLAGLAYQLAVGPS